MTVSITNEYSKDITLVWTNGKKVTIGPDATNPDIDEPNRIHEIDVDGTVYKNDAPSYSDSTAYDADVSPGTSVTLSVGSVSFVYNVSKAK